MEFNRPPGRQVRMHDEHKLHVKPWRHRRGGSNHRRQGEHRKHDRWPTVIGWIGIALVVATLVPPALILVLPGLGVIIPERVALSVAALVNWNPHSVLYYASMPFFADRIAHGCGYEEVFVTGDVVTLLVCALHLAGGILLLRRRPLARPLLLSWCGILIAAHGWVAIYYLLAVPLQAWPADILPEIIWPVFLLVWFLRPAIRKQIAGWSPGARRGNPASSAAHGAQEATSPPRPLETRPDEWWKQWDR